MPEKKKSKAKLTDVYCGIGPTPRGEKIGTQKECLENKQVRLYGKIQISQKMIDELELATKGLKKLKAEATKHMGIVASMTGRLSDRERKLRAERNPEEKKKIEKEMEEIKQKRRESQKIYKEANEKINRIKQQVGGLCLGK